LPKPKKQNSKKAFLYFGIGTGWEYKVDPNQGVTDGKTLKRNVWVYAHRERMRNEKRDIK